MQWQQLASKLQKHLIQPWPDKLNLAIRLGCRVKGIVYYRRIFGSFGAGSTLFKPMLLCNTQFMHIGKNVSIREGVRLEAVMIDPGNPPELRIGNNVNIEQNVHIVFMGKVRIADNVSITARCSLLGGSHPFFDVNDPVKIGDRLAGSKSIIEIGEGSFLGIGTVVMMNVRIGKHVVIGANSVVKRSIPDYSVADGNPAVIVMNYDQNTQTWLAVKSKS